MTSHRSILPAAIIATGVILTGCGPKPAVDPRSSCPDDWNQAQRRFDRGDDARAQIELRDLTLRCSGSDFSEDAQFLLVRSLFRTRLWMETVSEATLFLEQFDRSARAVEASWMQSRSRHQLADTWDRDPSGIEEALFSLRQFRADFPDAPQIPEAIQLEADLLERLAQRLHRTGDLYLRLGEPQAAVVYYLDLLTEHPDRPANREAALQLVRAYARLDQFERAREVLAGLTTDTLVRHDRLKDAGEFIALRERRLERVRERERRQLIQDQR